MRVVYFDCFHGAAGDMLLASLLDAGLDLGALTAALAGLPLSGYTIEAGRAMSHSVSGTRLRVRLDAPQPARDWAEIKGLLQAADLPGRAKQNALAAFERLARAEARIHGVPVESVHFHEVGAVDSIVDTVGVCIGLELLGVERVFASALPLGHGWVRTQHGPLPVPAPATLALLAEAGAPTLPGPPDSAGELVTPTAAALLGALAEFRQPPMRIAAVGYGLGWKEFPRLNGLRAWIGEIEAQADRRPHSAEHAESGAHVHDHTTGDAASPGLAPSPASAEHETLVELRCNLDDATGELVAYAIEGLLAAGALDAWAAPLVMKKGRPALMLSALCRPADLERLAGLVLRETPTLGVRWSSVERTAAPRDQLAVATPWGQVRVKRKLLDGAVAGAAPEYEDCAALARAHGVPLAQVYAAALRAASG